jgi:predicted 2-oxoglutarate/Fe(II)-dependent dioxygenase YbiX
MNIEQDFLKNDKIVLILEYLQNTDDWISTDNIWSQRFINYSNITDDSVKKIVLEVAKNIAEEFQESVYIETAQLVRWRPGDKLDPPHADCEHIDGSPHPYPQRHYSALVYLNDDFKGGEIFFPNQNLKPKIIPGMMVRFTGTVEHLHGVTEVTEGLRYTMVFFLTRDKQFSIL